MYKFHKKDARIFPGVLHAVHSIFITLCYNTNRDPCEFAWKELFDHEHIVFSHPEGKL